MPSRRAYRGRGRAVEVGRARDDLPQPAAGERPGAGAARCGENLRNECLDTALASVASMVNTILSLAASGPPPQARRARQARTGVAAASGGDRQAGQGTGPAPKAMR
ncbi:hypothetical protein AB0F30_28640 [Streptomyces sp. NPDC029006]|uniref:hypothetical protein n=1 Tax=Streptomyces sp. NPDC029006 TaxID=3155467 RepID=UPI0033CCACBA